MCFQSIQKNINTNYDKYLECVRRSIFQSIHSSINNLSKIISRISLTDKIKSGPTRFPRLRSHLVSLSHSPKLYNFILDREWKNRCAVHKDRHIHTNASSGGFISQVTWDPGAKESASINSVNITLTLLSAFLPRRPGVWHEQVSQTHPHVCIPHKNTTVFPGPCLTLTAKHK